MKIRILGMIALFLAITLVAGSLPAAASDTVTAGNCLTFPVIWAEGVEKVLRGTEDMDPDLNNFVWWWRAPLDPSDELNRCEPDPNTLLCDNGEMCYLDPDNTLYCDDGVAGTSDPTLVPASTVKVYPQQDAGNEWQAGTATATDRVQVDLLDWGDNMESVDWYTKSKVRTEMVLLEDTTVVSDYDLTPEYMTMTQYLLKHVSGWGITELWGLSTTDGVADEVDPNEQSTVYSPCARFTIQKLMVLRNDPALDDLVWTWDVYTDSEGKPVPGWASDDDLINEPIFNRAVWDAGDGPDFYSAEINVKGKVMYGYNWDVEVTNDMTPVPPATENTAVGDYRLTFSFDDTCGEGITVNTFFSDIYGNPVSIFLEDVVVSSATLSDIVITEEGDESDVGGTGVIDYVNDLTYMDVRILEQEGGDGGGEGGNGGDGEGNGHMGNKV